MTHTTISRLSLFTLGQLYISSREPQAGRREGQEAGKSRLERHCTINEEAQIEDVGNSTLITIEDKHGTARRQATRPRRDTNSELTSPLNTGQLSSTAIVTINAAGSVAFSFPSTLLNCWQRGSRRRSGCSSVVLLSCCWFSLVNL